MTKFGVTAVDDLESLPQIAEGGSEKYDRVFLVDIDKIDLYNLNISVKLYTGNIVISSFKQIDGKFMKSTVSEWVPVNPYLRKEATTKLDLHIKALKGIVIFQLGQNLRFIDQERDDTARAVFTVAQPRPGNLQNANWVGGSPGNRQAVSMVVSGYTDGPQIYGLGIVVTDAGSGTKFETPIIIDPKIENDGNGHPFITPP